VQVFYSLESKDWENRQWLAVDAHDDGQGSYTAEVPGLDEGALWYVLAVDDRTVGVSSEVFGLKD
jgi:hypothetical protein